MSSSFESPSGLVRITSEFAMLFAGTVTKLPLVSTFLRQSASGNLQIARSRSWFDMIDARQYLSYYDTYRLPPSHEATDLPVAPILRPARSRVCAWLETALSSHAPWIASPVPQDTQGHEQRAFPRPPVVAAPFAMRGSTNRDKRRADIAARTTLPRSFCLRDWTQ
ncbi:hypothetical protein CPLU01_03461 [Colletotrichum plurivorum]|uniref:Uncharacterized protein n=1 Tax=Colletotrichum plurivorum TaxID=2175906 RepID=A0A8H6KTB0_9PEZI|nr:hypothetical protein CPLU01_03461 [Colletotrichum plurivorum]